MQIEFRAIVHSEYGAPEKVLTIAERQFKTEDLGVDDVLVKVRARPVHPGDIHILSALPQGGPIVPIPEGTLRVPGFEGVGTILQIGTNPEAAKRFSEGPACRVLSGNGLLGRVRGRPIQVPLASFGRNPRSNCGPNAHQYGDRFRTHQSRPQFTQTADDAAGLYPSECGGI